MRIFKEEQRFNQTWIIVLLVLSAIIPSVIITNRYLENSESLSTAEFIGTLSIVVIATGLIFFFKLSTRIDEKGIYYKFFPFQFKPKLIEWQEINKAYVRNYDAITEYGGWGLKGGALWNKSKGRAINVSGDIGIQLQLKNGKKLLIGTQKKEEAIRVLEAYKIKLNTDV
ncbi:hypothetical protein [Winogradskyella algicola]|uniref:hypothetical protein n=1 Tax=Winogradskyella algicola TaxID=2575815 RepID=UPI00148652CC|nr:hypothetical protein [Winogradskyella algicola]